MKKIILPAILTLTCMQPGKAQTNPAPACFNPAANYGAGNAPTSVSSADFNGDGKADLAVANWYDNTVSVLLNAGAGTFGPRVNYAVGTNPWSVSSADFNGDGKADLAVANTNDNAVSVLLNAGAGTFSPSVNYVVGNTPQSVSSADFNGDGKADIVTANIYNNTVSVLLNAGAGTFSSAVSYAVGNYPVSVSSADFNGDGKADLAVANFNDTTVSVLLNAGAGTFSPRVNYATGNFPSSVSSADFNGDGKADLVVTNNGDNTVSILLNAGAGIFKPRVSYAVETNPQLVSSADFNGDGKVDLAVANQSDNTVSVLLNAGAGIFSPRVNYAVGNLPKSVSSADFNGDGKADIATANGFSNDVSVLLTCPVPQPPVPSYPTLPANICVGSSINQGPVFSGGSAQFTAVVDSSISISAPKAICRNSNGVFVLNANDSILFYDFSGNLQPAVYNNGLYNNVSAMAADNSNRVYVVVPDPYNAAISTVNRFMADGSWDASFSVPSYVLPYITALSVSPVDGYVYIADTTTGSISKLDPNTATVSTLSPPSNNNYSFSKPCGIAFGENNDLYLMDRGLKKVLKRDAASGNFYSVIPGLDTASWNMNSLDIDTVDNPNYYILSSKTGTFPVLGTQVVNTSGGTPDVNSLDYSVLIHPRNPAGSVYSNRNNTLPILWVANTGGNNIKRFSIFSYLISPPLPAGLHYDFINGIITGTPNAPAPAQTYTITTQNNAGTSTLTISFSIDPPGPVSNAVGTHTSTAMQSDGLNINYFDPNNCSPMLAIADSVGGSVVGNVVATQTVYPTIATFNADTFIARVTSIDAQNTNASAKISLYFTYLDIVHFNQVVPAASHLSNDTVGGTMQVGVLQLHDSSDIVGIGNTVHVTPIIHNPITANWSHTKSRWQVDINVTKFSTFYVSDTGRVGSFSCVTRGHDSIVSSNSYYIWHNDTLHASGVYMDTLTNANLCDSIVRLKLTLTQTTGISQSANSNGVYIYPNPGSGRFTVTVQNSAVTVQNIRVINTLGAEVYNKPVNGNTVIDLSAEESGVYYVIITSQDNTIIRRVIKQ